MLSGARIATLVALFAIALAVGFAAVDRASAGVPAAELVRDGTANQSRFLVRSAPAGDPLRGGERIAIEDAPELAAYTLHALPAGSTLTVRRLSPLPEAWVREPIVAARTTIAYIVLPIQLLFLLVAAVIAARGRANGSLQLAWLLALIVTLVNPTAPAWSAWLVLGYAVIASSIAVVALVCAADFASRFASDPAARWSRRYRRIAYACGIVAAAPNVVVSWLTYHTAETSPILATMSFVPITALAVVFLAGLGIAYFKARDAERQKTLWVATSLGVGILGFFLALLLEGADVKEPLRDVPLLLLIAMPLGCAYAILRYRLLDIAFVVNRATVFGVTSLLVLAALALVDFGLQNLLGSWLVGTGLYVQLALALAIGIATRPLHERVDHFVDDLFFRRRHEAERTLRDFARDVAHIDDAGVVLQRTTETIARAAELRCSIFLLRDRGYREVEASDGSHESNGADRNDPAVVKILATRGPVDLHEARTALSGDFAFPMFARDRLLGIVVCGGKADGVATYAPDELDAIGAVARAAGLALDLLRIEALERELAELRPRAQPTRPRPAARP